jgi:Integrase core domain
MESFFGSLKTELVHRTTFPGTVNLMREGLEKRVVHQRYGVMW